MFCEGSARVPRGFREGCGMQGAIPRRFCEAEGSTRAQGSMAVLRDGRGGSYARVRVPRRGSEEGSVGSEEGSARFCKRGSARVWGGGGFLRGSGVPRKVREGSGRVQGAEEGSARVPRMQGAAPRRVL